VERGLADLKLLNCLPRSQVVADPSVALAWIVDLLTSREVPFQAVGGLAARAYGATRPLVDLDFYLPLQRYGDIGPAVLPHLTRAPRPYRDDAWDLTFAQIVYAGQKIELGGILDARYYDRVEGCWRPQVVDFSRSRWVELFRVVVPVMPKEELIAYKSRLGREVDRQDLAEIAAASRA
jgi:hypothetical protein